jgi:hypothetical protein
VLTAVIYLIIRALLGLPMDWANAAGSTLMWSGLGGSFGWILGVGAFSPGASAHEGPVATWAENAKLSRPPGLLAQGRINTVKFFKWAIPLILPNLRPLAIALGVIVVITLIFMLLGTNGIVSLGRLTTQNDAANTAEVTGDKLIIFLIIAAVVIGLLVGTAVGLALLMTSLTRQVEIAKKINRTVLPDDSPLLKLGRYFERLLQFGIAWVRDIIDGLTKTTIR